MSDINMQVSNAYCVKVYKRPYDGQQEQPKHVVMNKLIAL
jgi:hypothetical protein